MRVAAVLRYFVPVIELDVLKSSGAVQKRPVSWIPCMAAQVMMDYVLDLLPVITCIIDMSLALGHVPASVKAALVAPLIKKPLPDKEVLQNYRSVLNLTFLSKVLERVVSARLREYLTANCLLEPRESAYRTRHRDSVAESAERPADGRGRRLRCLPGAAI